jgi:hypothetical protein
MHSNETSNHYLEMHMMNLPYPPSHLLLISIAEGPHALY